MHDIVAHGLAVMISLAHGSAEIAPTDPARAVQAMRQVAETGRVAVADMRRMLGVLNEDNTGELAGAAAPSPGVGCSRAGGTIPFCGLPGCLQSAGVAPADPGIQLAVYRVIQEGLTNALKYARAATAVTVRSQFTGQEIMISVTQTTASPWTPLPTVLGTGVAGMRQRVALYGGTCARDPWPRWMVRDRTVPAAGRSHWKP